MTRERSPGMKLIVAGAVAALLIIPLLMIYGLVWDRESQSNRAQDQITAGWGGAQTVTGPVLVIPYVDDRVTNYQVDGLQRERRERVRSELFVSPVRQEIATEIDPDSKGYAIYESVVYETRMSGTARFELTEELARFGIERSDLLLPEAELRFGVSDTSGLTDTTEVLIDGVAGGLTPGEGLRATGGSGFSANAPWAAERAMQVSWQYGLRGSRSLSLVPRGGQTEWQVTSPWPHPSFTGDFPPNEREISAEGFTATYSGINNLSLGSGIMALEDDVAPRGSDEMREAAYDEGYQEAYDGRHASREPSAVATIGLTDPVDLYSQVNRAVKYGFLFIGFTFATFLLFDVVGGARVATVEYLLTGAGLVLFFVMLLAFAEVVGFGLAYVIAAAAIIGLLTAYSAAVLGTWRRAAFIGAMLCALYVVLYVLLNMETFALVVGSLLLFAALAGIMYATRNVDWSSVRGGDEGEPAFA